MKVQTVLDAKKRILEGAGYTYSFDRMIYFNRDAKKVFSIEFVEDHNEVELQRCINEDTEEGKREWHFYFTSPPSGAIRRELESVLR
ncbi:MAG TPA: hypothetical protein VFG71_06780 [Nitrospiraceae bacterium]|nr:hypothetical protein [Nitrospiraceae bacterium]